MSYLVEDGETLKIREELRGYHHGQKDLRLLASDAAGNTVGGIDFSEYDGVPHIDMVMVRDANKRRGAGSQLIDYLAKTYEYKNIKWGMLTDEGAALKRAMDKKYGM